MNFRTLYTIAIVLFCLCTIIFTFSYGPSTRRYVYPAETVRIKSASDLYPLWESKGVHGRSAVLFTRHLVQQPDDGLEPKLIYLDMAMRRGVVRTAFHVVQDFDWPSVVSENLDIASTVPMKTNDSGFVLLHDGGRISAMPFTNFVPGQQSEKVLVVIEEGVWSARDQARIEDYIRSGQISADLVTYVGSKIMP